VSDLLAAAPLWAVLLVGAGVVIDLLVTIPIAVWLKRRGPRVGA
jgi:hypothetical protein